MKNRNPYRRFGLVSASLLAGLLFSLACLAGVPVASATTITVTTTADDYNQDPATCSLREAITAANDNKAFGGCEAGEQSDFIRLPQGEYVVTKVGAESANKSGDFNVWGSGELEITPKSDQDVVVIDGSQKGRVLSKSGSGILTIKGVNIANGSDQAGGGLNISGPGRLILEGSSLAANRADWGGAIAVLAESTAEIVNSTIYNNQAQVDGGGLAVQVGGNLTVRSSTVVQNTADTDKNGSGEGGGIVNRGMTKMVNTILAWNVDASPDPAQRAPDCLAEGTGFLPRFVLSTQKLGTGTCPVGYDPGTNLFGDPLLDTFGSHGGTTYNWNLKPTSPAIDAAGKGSPDMCPNTDQRGHKRFAIRCDIGSYEADDSELLIDHPASPTDLATNPPSPGATTAPRVRGKAPSGQYIRIFSTADCSGAPIASGSSEEFATNGLPVDVAKGSTSTFRAVATNKENRNSLCSTSSVIYTQKDKVGGTGTELTRPTSTTATFDGRRLYVRVKCPPRFRPKCLSRAVPVTAKGRKGKPMGRAKSLRIRSGKWVEVTFQIKPAYRARVQAMTRTSAHRLVVRQRIRSKRVGKRKLRKPASVFHTYRVRTQG